MSILDVPDPPILPLVVFEAVSVTPAFAPVTMMLAVVAVRSDEELSVMAFVVEVILTALVVRFAVVIAVEPKFTLPALAVKVIVPASVLSEVTFNAPVEAVKEKFNPVV